MIKSCKICDKAFQPFKTTDRFCSPQCAGKHEPKKQARSPKIEEEIDQSEYKVFIEIWNERKHISELTGEPLLPVGHDLWHWQFAHLLNKQTYSRFKYRKEYIIMALPEEHESQETFPEFIALRDSARADYYKELSIG